ncbi:MAG: hemolysin III family protein, partial [Oligoflexia bacterium]|nr:hemolysin III family protein [Oligoflexia bacterium]
MPRRPPVRFFKDPVSAITHFIGFLAALAGLLLLVATTVDEPAMLVGVVIYGSTLVALFLASATYHFLDLGTKGNRWLRRVDHAGIFLLIAGSYVPPLLHLLHGAWRIAMLSAVAGLALLGIVFKLVWIDCPSWLGTMIYLILGWLVVIPAYQILPQLTPIELGCLVTGGLLYTGGAAVYVLERPDPWPGRF